MDKFANLIFRKASWIYKRDLLKILNQETGKTLDIGGDNFMKKYIKTASIDYTSLNYSYGDTNDKRYKCDIVANAMDMPEIKDSSYENVWCFQVLEHVNEPLRLLKESKRVLIPGGKVIFSIPQNSLLHEAPNNFYNFTKYGIQNLFELSGFVSIEIKPRGGFWLSSANRLFDYIMVWIESMRIVNLGFGYSIFEGKNLFQKLVAFTSIIPAILLFGVNLILACLIKSADLNEDASIHYVIAYKSK